MDFTYIQELHQKLVVLYARLSANLTCSDSAKLPEREGVYKLGCHMIGR